MRLARMVRKDALAQVRDQLLERAPALGSWAGDERVGLDAGQRTLHRLLAERREVVGDEIRDLASQPAHRLAVELEGRRRGAGRRPVHETSTVALQLVSPSDRSEIFKRGGAE